ncbi:MAG: 2,4-diaminopentanoate dehydrogenase [Candidatus Izemoplasmatales bacterium]|nr:2,4-diaminopentanoate dehydrogenase [Candidatus Izemoplasmatales bacterium]
MRKNKVKVVIWGFGAMGSGMARMILNKQGFDIVGICDMYDKLVGKSMYEVLNIDVQNHDVKISNNIETLIESTKPEIVLLATDSYTNAAFPKIKFLVEHGCNVISTAEEMAYPYAKEPILSKELNDLAKRNNVTILGTGVNPGMMMDLLAITLTGIMRDVKDFNITRVNSLSPFGKTVMEEQGVGFSVSEFNEKREKGLIAGHVGFIESTHMIANALGLKVTDFHQSMDPIITDVDRKSPYGYSKKGDVCGVDMRSYSKLSNYNSINMRHPQQIEPELGGVKTRDSIEITGQPFVNMTISPEIDGGIGTIAICVNMIPHVINANPGLKTMIDLPVPRAIMGDVRLFLDEE